MAPPTRRRIRFLSPGEVEVLTEEAPTPRSGEVQVRTHYSAISPGTERLVYRGKVPDHLQADPSIEALKEDDFSYPLSYGYACVGEVEKVGKDVKKEWLGRRVFGFQPHVSRFVADPDSLVRVPKSVQMEDAVLIPSVETAVNLVMDGRPMIGERVLVFGQGVIGLLVTRLLSDHPMEEVIGVDPLERRRSMSKNFGATEVADPSRGIGHLKSLVSSPRHRRGDDEYGGADLLYELTGTPSVLNDAIQCSGYEGRIVVGSWYGTKQTPLDLGGHFHRSRIQIISSQVSTIASPHRGRWSKSRRMSVVLDLLEEIRPSNLVSDYFAIDQAPMVYENLGSDDASPLQPVFSYL